MHSCMVTGASGFLGREVVARMDADVDVIGICHVNPKPEFERVDLRDEDGLRRHLDRYQPDAVIHLAAYRDPDFCEEHPGEARRLNVEPVHTLHACLPDHVPLLFASTDYVFDGTGPPYVESDKIGPVNVYGQTKIEAESVVLARTSGIVLRMPLLIGAGATWELSGFISQMWDSVRHKTRQSQDNVLKRFPTWTRDVANVMSWLLEQEQSGLFHVSGLRGGTRYQWMLEFGSLVGESTDHLIPSKATIPRRAVRPFDSQLQPARLQSMGYRGLTDFSDVVKEVMSSFSQPPFEEIIK